MLERTKLAGSAFIASEKRFKASVETACGGQGAPKLSLDILDASSEVFSESSVVGSVVLPLNDLKVARGLYQKALPNMGG